MTEKVVEANRKRAANSTGATSEAGKMNSSGNALKAGVTAKKILPEQDETFRQRVEEQWREDYKPVGIWEANLIRDLSFLDAKDAILERLEQQEISDLGTETGDIFGLFKSGLDLPIDQLDLPVQQGWVCEHLRIRAIATEDSARGSASREPKPMPNQGRLSGFEGSNDQRGSGRSLEVEAGLRSSLDRILRYRAAIRKDRYRAVEALHAAQAERRERDREEREREGSEQREKSKAGQNLVSEVK